MGVCRSFFLGLGGLSKCKYIVINDRTNRNVLILIYFIQINFPHPYIIYVPQMGKLAFLTTTSATLLQKKRYIPFHSHCLPFSLTRRKKEKWYLQQKGKSSPFPSSLIYRRIIPDFPFPSSDEEAVSIFRTITFRLNRPLSSGLITVIGLSVFSRAPGSVALAFPAALLLLLLGEVLLLLSATDVVSLLETGDGLAALLLLLLSEVSFVLPAEIVRWRRTGAGKLSFLSIASTVR